MKFIGSILLLFQGLTSFAQSSACDISKLTSTDKKLLTQFWKDFTAALNAGNKSQLAALVKFPFNCDYCVADTTKPKDYNYLKVTK